MSSSNGVRIWAIGGVVFAATMMTMLGIWQILVGIAAIVDDDFFAVTPNYTYEVDTTTWGWIHLILGVIVLLAGFALFSGAIWARAVGVFLASLVAINNFLFLPYHPLWAILVIALAVFVIWALVTVTRPERPAEVPASMMPR